MRRAGANENAEKRANFFSVIGKYAGTAEFFHSFCAKPVEKCKPLWKTLWKLCKTRKNRGSRVLRPVVENPPERNAGNSDTVFQHFPIFPHTEAKIALSPPRGARGRRKGRPGAQSIKYVPKPEVHKPAFRRIFALQAGTSKRTPPPKGDPRSPGRLLPTLTLCVNRGSRGSRWGSTRGCGDFARWGNSSGYRSLCKLLFQKAPSGRELARGRLREHARQWELCKAGKFILLSHPRFGGRCPKLNPTSSLRALPLPPDGATPC